MNFKFKYLIPYKIIRIMSVITNAFGSSKEAKGMAIPNKIKKKVRITNEDSTVIVLNVLTRSSNESLLIKCFSGPLNIIFLLFRIRPKARMITNDERCNSLPAA